MNPDRREEPTAEYVLGPDGPIAQAKPGYESRPQQLEMAAAVADAISSKHHLVVEAGTGVGKSLAYAVPAIMHTIETGKKVVISTDTIALQQQLIADLEFLQGVMPRGFQFALLKGRKNYLSRRRLGVAMDETNAVFPDLVEKDARLQADRIFKWSKMTHDGTKADLDFIPMDYVWGEIRSDEDHCKGIKCASHKACFYYSARAKVQAAHVLVVNHAFYMTHLKVARKKPGGILPEHDVLIVDEAHELEDVATKCLGDEVSSVTLFTLLNKIYSEKSHTKRGILARVQFGMPDEWFNNTVKQVKHAMGAAIDFFEGAEKFLARRGKNEIRFCDPPRPEDWPHADRLVEELKNLMGFLKEAASICQKEERKAELASKKELAEKNIVLRMEFEANEKRCWETCLAIHKWVKHTDPDTVYWIERDPEKGVITMAYAPLNVGPILRDDVWAKIPTCILTSATLAVGSPTRFDHVRARLGLDGDDVETLAVGSPFDYANHVKLHLPMNLPDPVEQADEYERQAIRAIPNYLWKTRGNAFVLFTSNEMMRKADRVLRPWIVDKRGWTLLVQDEMPTPKLIERFKAGGCVLFGVDTFWTGMDIPGEALSNVIIMRLPFSVPDKPLIAARIEDVNRRGGNGFADFSLPNSIIKFKQGFGRLIRTKTDWGIVVLIDPRLTYKRYGMIFLDSIPACPIIKEDIPDNCWFPESSIPNEAF